ncbi:MULTISPECIES: hypothetical protein [Providencia]|uniref:hypothetical protein n=1 Tax=Providencia TaxID=586 RepID=UPI00197F1371|nr:MULTISPECIES: hypothetical protein [Providencia]MBN4866508.1 sugar transferase [Providencia stuartii]MBN4875830.1 sugar transferase [Providencia stuartii]MBN4880522.1 sugar transferase [Providencia stuartii]MBN4885030.1 sugar transferase [Providencia stuartii]
MNENTLAPIVLFVYARPEHTRLTINSLKNNPECINSNLIIYSDAPKNNFHEKNVRLVRDLIKNIKGFKSVTINLRKKNHGLAKNIISGVSETCKKYGKAIILEDDIITSPSFLKFMNDSLNKYKNEKSVWHISGWNYPINTSNIECEAFFWRTMNCWGWATWEDRWNSFNKDPKNLINNWEKNKIKKFNLDGHYNFWAQVIQNNNKKIDTWAIFWYATIFENSGLCLNPIRSLVYNNGNDGSGENCSDKDIYKNSLSNNHINIWPKVIEENIDILILIKKFYDSNKPGLFLRVLAKIKKAFK